MLLLHSLRKALPRHLTARIQRALSKSRVVSLVGPRQAGKSTLVRGLVGEESYYTLDDDALRNALREDPWGQLQVLLADRSTIDGPLVLDEVQRVPEITLAIKRIVDRDPSPGQFLLTGSADILTSGAAADSLAGRATTFRLLPLSAAEVEEHPPSSLLEVETWDDARAEPPWVGLAPVSRPDVIDRIVRGGYPEIRTLDDDDRMDRHVSYLESVVERDFAALHAIRKPDALRRLVDQLAARTGQELNIASLSRDVSIRRETLEIWLEALERLGLLQRVGAWTASPARREIRAPKLHFLDTGTVAALRGEGRENLALKEGHADLGPLLETWVFSEVIKLLPIARRRWRPWHWRIPHREVDLLLEAPGQRLLLLEVKASSRVREEDARHVKWFMREGPGKGRQCTGVVLYLGDHLQRLDSRIWAVPLSIFWSGRVLKAAGQQEA